MNILQHMLKIDEGLELKPYKCTAGRWTIGVGRNLDDKGITLMEAVELLGLRRAKAEVKVFSNNELGIKILPFHDVFESLTEAEAMYLLDNDIADACADLRLVLGSHITPIEINNPRHMALISMMFNLGHGRFRGFKKMILAIKNGDWEKAAAEAKDSNWYDQVGHRSKRICHMLATGSLHPDYIMD